MKKLTFILIALISSTALMAQDQTINGTLFQNLNNLWLSPAKIQIGRLNTTIYKDRAVIGVTNGNLHIDSYPGYVLFFNYYQEGSINSNKGMLIDANGYVAIGLRYPTAKLDVDGGIKATPLDINGTIRSKEVKIEATGWSDFVFGEDYKLPALSEVESHIKEYKHLPDVPSEKQVIEEGVNVAEMQAKLLQKIEELTLYVIEQDKKILKQDKKIKQLEEKLTKE